MIYKVTDMKTLNKIAAGIIAIAASSASLAFAADTSQLLGKDLDQNRELVNSVMQGRNYMVQVDQAGKIKQIIDTGANGDGSDPLQPAAAANAVQADDAVASVELPINYEGQQAIDFLGAELPKVAGGYGLAPEKLREMLLSDDSLRIDGNNRMFYVDQDSGNPGAGEPETAGGATTATTSNTTVPIASTAQLANAFKLHSKPGASKTIYLNFVGYTASKTAWSSSTIAAPAYDLSGNPAVFDDNERSNIISIWNRVAEDYIAFDVDVTTEPPSSDALLRTSSADTSYGTQVVITKTGTISCNCGGIAYVGVVSMVNNTYYQPAWVFQQSLANNEKYIAEAVSHEAGHTLGLLHDGQKTGTTTVGYYSGHGSGDTGWAPIMGVGYYKNVTQWSAGVYPGANNQQNDLAVMASAGFTQRADDFGNAFGTASSLNNTATGATANISTFGVIETAADVDMFIVNTAGGLVNLSVKPAAKGPNLDVKATLFKADGSVVATSAAETSLAATISSTVPAGVYYLAVSPSAHAAAGTDYGYPAYASLGQYSVTGSFAVANAGAAAPAAVIGASTLSGPSALTVNFSANKSVGNGNITKYQWSFGDGGSSTSANPVYTYKTAGTFTAKLTVTNQYNLTDTKSVQVVVTAPPVKSVAAGSASMMVARGTTATGMILLRVVDAQGRPVPNAVVTGTWSGALSGTSVAKTGTDGVVIHTSKPSKQVKAASGVYTLNSISATGYTYAPAKNVKSVFTMTW